MQGPKVSIIINCYNSDKYLREAVDSVLRQTYSNWELVFWDNQSTDQSAEIIRSYKDDRIRYHLAESHTSLGEARNWAMRVVEGEYVSFLDADDYYEPERIEVMLGGFSNGEVLVYSNGQTLNQRKGTMSKFYSGIQASGDVFRSWVSAYEVMIPSVMFKRSSLDRLEEWFDTRFSMIEEYDFFLRLVQGERVGYCDQALCTWRLHENSLSWTKMDDWAKEFAQFQQKLFLIDAEIAAEKSSILDRRIALWRCISKLCAKQESSSQINEYKYTSIKFLAFYLGTKYFPRITEMVFKRVYN